VKKTTWIASIVLALAIASPAAAGGLYLDVFTGLNQTDDTDFAVLGTSRIDTDVDNGTNYGVTFGYDFDSQWRVEGELSLREADVNTHDLDGGGSIP
jgi:hypothetical protein